jgi:hypothetical protein
MPRGRAWPKLDLAIYTDRSWCANQAQTVRLRVLSVRQLPVQPASWVAVRRCAVREYVNTVKKESSKGLVENGRQARNFGKNGLILTPSLVLRT